MFVEIDPLVVDGCVFWYNLWGKYKADSLPLDHQGSPKEYLIKELFTNMGEWLRETDKGGTRVGPRAIPRSPGSAEGNQEEELLERHAWKELLHRVEGRAGGNQGNKTRISLSPPILSHWCPPLAREQGSPSMQPRPAIELPPRLKPGWWSWRIDLERQTENIFRTRVITNLIT